MTDHFQLVAGHLALDFANTLDNRYGPEWPVELLPTYQRLAAFARQSEIITGAQARRLTTQTSERDAAGALARAIELRDTLHFLFRSVATSQAPNQSCLRTFNRFLADARSRETLSWRKPDFVRSRRDVATSPDGLLWPVVEAAATLLTSPDRRHVRECSAETCRWLFLDRSKNHTRRWCNMKVCGNRSKAQRFYGRRGSA